MQEEYEVQEILEHRGNPKYKSTMEFLVHWAHYDDPKDYTWEPWSHVRLVDKLHEYLIEHNMKQLIPSECTKDQEAEPSRYQKRANKRKAQEETVTSNSRRKPISPA